MGGYYTRHLRDIERKDDEMAKVLNVSPKDLNYREVSIESVLFADMFNIVTEDLDVLISQTADEGSLVHLHEMRALAHEQSGHIEKALSDVTWLINHNHPAGYGWRGMLAFVLRRYESAIRDFTLSLEQADTPVPQWLLCRARAYYRLGKYANACQDLLKALSLDREFNRMPFYFYLARVYYKLGEVGLAHDYFNKFAKEYGMSLLPDAHAYMRELAPGEAR